MAKKAEAWKEYREAAMVDMLLEALPKVSSLPEIHYKSFTIVFTFFVFHLRLLLKSPHHYHKPRRLQWSHPVLVKLELLN